MNIRKTTMADLPAVMKIYADARRMMAESGNPTQWKSGHPAQAIIENDIAAGLSYVCTDDDGKILAVFYFTTTPDPNYANINGTWKNNEPYGVIHRIARAKDAKGAGAFCINWCFEQIPNIRIDTHKDNAPMLKLLPSLGFEYCGIIRLAEINEERMAFQKKE